MIWSLSLHCWLTVYLSLKCPINTKAIVFPYFYNCFFTAAENVRKFMKQNKNICRFYTDNCNINKATRICIKDQYLLLLYSCQKIYDIQFSIIYVPPNVTLPFFVNGESPGGWEYLVPDPKKKLCSGTEVWRKYCLHFFQTHIQYQSFG